MIAITIEENGPHGHFFWLRNVLAFNFCRHTDDLEIGYSIMANAIRSSKGKLRNAVIFNVRIVRFINEAKFITISIYIRNLLKFPIIISCDDL